MNGSFASRRESIYYIVSVLFNFLFRPKQAHGEAEIRFLTVGFGEKIYMATLKVFKGQKIKQIQKFVYITPYISKNILPATKGLKGIISVPRNQYWPELNSSVQYFTRY